MKKLKLQRLLCALLMIPLTISAVSCNGQIPTDESSEETESVSESVLESETNESDTGRTDTDETDNDETDREEDTNIGIGVEDMYGINYLRYSASALPDYSEYVTEARIKEKLGSTKTYAFALGGVEYYENGVLKSCEEGIVGRTKNGNITLDSEKLGKLLGVSGLKGSYPQLIASALNMK